MRIALVEPFFTGSHKRWALGLQENSTFNIDLFTLPGRHWKWRMHGAAITLARQIGKAEIDYDVILTTDMLNVGLFRSLLDKKLSSTPVAVYFHENQLSYPWSQNDPDVKLKRDKHYRFINYTSALVADRVYFNSEFHRTQFLGDLVNFLNYYPDYNNLETIDEIRRKSGVLPLGLSLRPLDKYRQSKESTGSPVILWNHRWEYDKDPKTFFRALSVIKQKGIDFRLVVLGESFRQVPEVFENAREEFSNEIIHWGYCPSFADYAKWLWRSHILPVTAIQDFFGISTVEAIYCGCIPVLPTGLAYEDHINDKSFFYKDFNELIFLLEKVLLDYPSLKNLELFDQVQHYDWSKCAKNYDQTFETLKIRKK